MNRRTITYIWSLCDSCFVKGENDGVRRARMEPSLQSLRVLALTLRANGISDFGCLNDLSMLPLNELMLDIGRQTPHIRIS